jgi:hypothetical protein
MNAGRPPICEIYSVRLFSTKSFKALGTLIYHKAGVQALAFARACPATALRHDQHPAIISARRDGGGGGDCGDVPGTRSLAADTRDASRSGYDDDNGGNYDDHNDDGDRDCDDDDDDDNDITVRDSDGQEEDQGEGNDDDDGGDEMSAGEKARRSRWLVSGAKDGRVVVWALMDFRGEGRAVAGVPT